MKSGFLEKLIGRLGKIGPEDVQNYLLRLAQEKGFLETVFNAIQEGIIVTDSSGKITYMNDAACELFGLDAEDSIGKQLDERVRGLDWHSLTRSGGPVTRDLEIFYPSNRFINFYIVPLMIEHRTEDVQADGAGHQVGYAIILRDITESRRTAEKTIESERMNALTLLAAGVAHEIGNPLNSLNIHLQLMKRAARKLEGQERDELEQSIKVARDEIEARDIVVESELRSDLPLVQIDRDQMKQAFYNIIKNSFEAMKRRGILRIRTDMDDSHVRVSFTDNGGGMSAEALSRVFEPYYTTKSRGSGLGLLIVRRIVREHGGELAIESAEGKGLTLTIRLPFKDQRVRMLEAGKRESRKEEDEG